MAARMRDTLVVAVFAVIFCVCASIKLCNSTDDCTMGKGCRCQKRGLEAGQCINPNTTQREIINECKKCNKDSDCDARGCFKGKCASCVQHMVDEGFGNCSTFSFQYCPDDKCGKPGCSCRTFNDTGLSTKICSNNEMFRNETKNCPTCTQNSDCPNSYCADTRPLLGRSICDSCESQPRIDAYGDCSFGVADRNDIRDLLVNPPTPSPSASPSIGAATLGSNGDPESTPTQPCVSTEWLRQNSLSHAALRHGDRAEVLCIPGLPCGTHGHLLRNSDGELVTYRQACVRRTDCVVSVMPVSQLSHIFDWTRFHNSDHSLTLTSLSVHPSATGVSPSRIVANAADALIAARLGWVCNAIVLLLHRVQPSLHYVQTFVVS